MPATNLSFSHAEPVLQPVVLTEGIQLSEDLENSLSRTLSPGTVIQTLPTTFPL